MPYIACIRCGKPAHASLEVCLSCWHLGHKNTERKNEREAEKIAGPKVVFVSIPVQVLKAVMFQAQMSDLDDRLSIKFAAKEDISRAGAWEEFTTDVVVDAVTVTWRRAHCEDYWVWFSTKQI